jgi:hypothetical protein
MGRALRGGGDPKMGAAGGSTVSAGGAARAIRSKRTDAPWSTVAAAQRIGLPRGGPAGASAVASACGRRPRVGPPWDRSALAAMHVPQRTASGCA